LVVDLAVDIRQPLWILGPPLEDAHEEAKLTDASFGGGWRGV
jgi:hypothetical protein